MGDKYTIKETSAMRNKYIIKNTSVRNDILL